MPRAQTQSGGDDSTNIQARRDVVVYGVTVETARSIAQDVFDSNFLRLRDVAADVARERADRITRDFLDELQSKNTSGLNSVQDPDMLQAIFNAQKAYALSGEEDLEKVLVDLLVDRAGQNERDLKTLVLNEAIATLPKLSADQRSTIAIIFVTKRTRWAGGLDVNVFYNTLEQHWAPFVASLPSGSMAAQHIMYAGAGAMEALSTSLEERLIETSLGLFTDGFSSEGLPDQLRPYLNDQEVFIPSIRHKRNLQFNAFGSQDLRELAARKGIDYVLASNIANRGKLGPPQIREEVTSRVPALVPLFDKWIPAALGRLDLTSVGVAIGHSYWRRVTGVQAPLDTWL